MTRRQRRILDAKARQVGPAAPSAFSAPSRRCFLALLTAHRKALTTLAVWTFHGGKDNVAPLAESERMVDAFKKAGVSDIRLDLDPDDGHDSWPHAGNDPTFQDWLLKHTR